MTDEMLNDLKYYYVLAGDDKIVSNPTKSYIANMSVKINHVTMLYVSEINAWFMRKNEDSYVMKLSSKKLSSYYKVDDSDPNHIIFETESVDGNKKICEIKKDMSYN